MKSSLVIDVWEGQGEIDETILKAGGVSGIGVRINDMNGGHHLDQGFKKQWEEAINFVRFPYFVYNPWVDAQANFNWLKANIPIDCKSVAIDIEVRYSGITKAKYAGNIVTFLNLCKPYWKTILYTGQWFLSELTSWPKVDYWWAQYPNLKVVTTWEEVKTLVETLTVPYNANTIPGTLKMWQFSGDQLILPGNNKKVDLNIFYGTEQELMNYFNNNPLTEYTLEQKVDILWTEYNKTH